MKTYKNERIEIEIEIEFEFEIEIDFLVKNVIKDEILMKKMVKLPENIKKGRRGIIF